jgi:hypothetical protein
MPDAPSPDDRPTADPGAATPPAPKKAAHAGGFTLDLSSGPGAGAPEAWRRKRKQASPILTKVVDLTAPKPAPAPPNPAKPAKPKKPASQTRRGEGRSAKEEPRKKPGGATLADLLDERTLARLRGET